MSLVLGVDGGGSKTRAIVVDATGDVVGEGVAASSNMNSVGFERAGGALREAVALTGVDPTTIAAACFGLAGVDREADARMEAFVVAERFAALATVVHDAELVLAAGTPEGSGVALICGTGSVAIGRAPDGRRTRAGGWGWLVGDEGSGYALGIAALRLATQSLDGRAGGAAVADAVLAAWGLADGDALLARVYDPDTTRAGIADLARVVLGLADAGDPAARALVEDAAAAAAVLVTTVARRLALAADAPLALAGGLVAHAGYRAHVCEAAAVAAERAVVVDDPARGAVILARRLAAR